MLKDDFDKAQDLIAIVQRILELQRKKPANAEYVHHKFMLDGLPPIEEAQNHTLRLKIAQLHYYTNYVYDDAERNHNYTLVTTANGSQKFIDEAPYHYEIMAIKHLKKLIRPPLQIFDFLDQAADYVAQGFDDPRLSEIAASFPYMPVNAKLGLGDALGNYFFGFAQSTLGLPVEPASTEFHDDDENPAVLATYMHGKTKDGDSLQFVTVSSRCLNQNIHLYLNSIFHEYTHNLFKEMRRIYTENPEAIEDHPFKDSMLYAWSISPRIGDNFLIKSVYDADAEEVLCNGTAARFIEQLMRYDPNNQITHQPLLEI